MHRRSVPARLAALGALLALGLATGCAGTEGGADDAPRAEGHAVSPLDNPDGTKPGLAPVDGDGPRAEARALIGKLPTKGRGPKTGYTRDAFGYAWMDTAEGVPFAGNHCDTRNDLLRRDGQQLRFRDGGHCTVSSMTLEDPYTGTELTWTKSKAAAVQIDHVVPLSYSWQMGSAHWPEAERRRLANDVLNLLPVEGRANSAKRDSGPAAWLPPNKAVRCAYAVRFAQVARKYELAVTAPDKQAMLEQCGG